MLLEQLRELGAALPVSECPTTADLPLVVSGLVYYAETGSLEPPKVEEPTPQTIAAAEAEQTRVAELETQLREAEQRSAAAAAGPSPAFNPPGAGEAGPDPAAVMDGAQEPAAQEPAVTPPSAPQG
jgi:hypothetical protein